MYVLLPTSISLTLGATLAAAGCDAELWECSAIIAAAGSAPQILHGDTVFTSHPQVFTALIALQDVERNTGPTRFVPRTQSGIKGESAHELLEIDNNHSTSDGGQASGHVEKYAPRVSSVVALLRAGEASLFDSRTLHCGGPHEPEGVEPLERVVFVLSFRHTQADDSLSNADTHGAGSVRPDVAALQLSLQQLRASAGGCAVTTRDIN